MERTSSKTTAASAPSDLSAAAPLTPQTKNGNGHAADPASGGLVGAGTAAMLEDLGHTVSEASSGVQALDTLRCHGRKIDLVITDYAMPGMTAIELTRRIQSSYPKMAVVLASGYADIADLADLADQGALPRLAKPFPQAELEAVIALAVGGGDGSGDNVVPLRLA